MENNEDKKNFYKIPEPKPLIENLKDKTEVPKMYIGLDGKSYEDRSALQEANRSYISPEKPYISPVTGQEYTSYDDMLRGEQKWWEERLKPRVTITPLH